MNKSNSPAPVATTGAKQVKSNRVDSNNKDNITAKTDKPVNTSAQCQRTALHRHMKKHGSVSTLQAREELGIMAPAPRIYELRHGNSSLNIQLTWIEEIDITGTKHRQGQYHLLPGKWKGGVK